MICGYADCEGTARWEVMAVEIQGAIRSFDCTAYGNPEYVCHRHLAMAATRVTSAIPPAEGYGRSAVVTEVPDAHR